MKKRMIAAALALCVCYAAVFSGCKKREERTLAEALSLLLYEIGCADACTVYDAQELLNGRDDGAFLASLFGDEQPRAALYGAEEGALALAARDTGFEIQIYRTAHPSQAREIAEILRDREALLKSVWNKRYLGEDFDRYLSSASVYLDGCCAALLATGDNDAILEKMKKLL